MIHMSRRSHHLGLSPSLPEYHWWANIQLKIWALKSYIFISCRIPAGFATNNSNLASSFCLDQTYQSRFHISVDEWPYYKLISSIIVSAISNNTHLTTFIFQNSVQPDNHPPERLHLQIFWKVDFQMPRINASFILIFKWLHYLNILWENAWEKMIKHPFPKCEQCMVYLYLHCELICMVNDR